MQLPHLPGYRKGTECEAFECLNRVQGEGALSREVMRQRCARNVLSVYKGMASLEETKTPGQGDGGSPCMLRAAGQVRATCYCLNADDKSKWRVKIESSVERFLDLHIVLGQQGAQAVAAKASCACCAFSVSCAYSLVGHPQPQSPTVDGR